MFVLDGSTSVGSENYARSIAFLKSVTGPMDVRVGGTNVAMEQYATMSRVEFLFQTDSTSLNAAFDNVGFLGGTTFTGRAITMANNQIYGVAGRTAAMPIMVLLTDGVSFDDISGPATTFKNGGGKIFVIGVGDASRPQLEPVASSEAGKTYLWFDSWDALDRINIEIAERICEEAPKSG